MLSIKDMQTAIGLILLFGTLVSAFLVIVGGTLYLLQHGGENLQVELLQTDSFHLGIKQIWDAAMLLTPLGLVELGLFCLVATQICRVGLLAFYYVTIRDYKFVSISLFILLMLLYSFLVRR